MKESRIYLIKFLFIIVSMNVLLPFMATCGYRPTAQSCDEFLMAVRERGFTAEARGPDSFANTECSVAFKTKSGARVEYSISQDKEPLTIECAMYQIPSGTTLKDYHACAFESGAVFFISSYETKLTLQNKNSYLSMIPSESRGAMADVTEAELVVENQRIFGLTRDEFQEIAELAGQFGFSDSFPEF